MQTHFHFSFLKAQEAPSGTDGRSDVDDEDFVFNTVKLALENYPEDNRPAWYYVSRKFYCSERFSRKRYPSHVG